MIQCKFSATPIISPDRVTSVNDLSDKVTDQISDSPVEYLPHSTDRNTLMTLSRNVGSIDKIIRLIAGAALAVWGILGAGLAGTVGIAATAVGAILIATGLINFCPLFKIFGISSFRS